MFRYLHYYAVDQQIVLSDQIALKCKNPEGGEYVGQELEAGSFGTLYHQVVNWKVGVVEVKEACPQACPQHHLVSPSFDYLIVDVVVVAWSGTLFWTVGLKVKLELFYYSFGSLHS